MVLSATLASLIVNVILNATTFNRQMSGARANVVQTAAKFYLLRTAVTAAVAALDRMISRAKDIEDGFTKIERIASNLRNTTFRADLFNLDENLKGINIGELQKSAQELSRLGIRDNLIGMTETLALFSKTSGVAAEDAALILGRITQLFDLPDRAQGIEHLANSIVEVAESMATSEREITDVLSRIGPVGQLAGFSVTELVGIAGTIKAIGQRSESASTAVQQLFLKLFTQTDEVLAALTASEDELKNLRDLMYTDVNAAFKEFLRIIGNKQFKSAAEVLSGIELSGKRVLPVILGLSKNTSLLTEAQAAAAKGANENIQIYNDYLMSLDNISSKMEGISDSWDQLGFVIGNNSMVKSALDEIEISLNSMKELIDYINNTSGQRDFDPTNIEEVKARRDAVKKEYDALVQANMDLRKDGGLAGFGKVLWNSAVPGEGLGIYGLITSMGRLTALEQERERLNEHILRLMKAQDEEANKSPLTKSVPPGSLFGLLFTAGAFGGAPSAFLNAQGAMDLSKSNFSEEALKADTKAKEKAAKEAEKTREKLFDNFWDIIKEQGHKKEKGGNTFSSLQDFWKNQITSPQERQNKEVLDKFDKAIDLAKENKDSVGNIQSLVKEFVSKYGAVK
ncbi:MAG: phage tail tape measure protein [Sphingobacteriaceae bacterium]|nr:phage tail tape measure protein [Sphingobacteriaceae bacterium]